MEIKVYNKIPQEIIDLRLEVFVKEQNIDIKDEMVGDDDEFIHIGLLINNQIVSSSRYKIINNELIIGRVLTKKSYRNKGYQSMIFNFIEQIAIKNNIDKIIVHSQITALDFYKKLGFNVVSDSYLDAGIVHYTMEKILK